MKKPLVFLLQLLLLAGGGLGVWLLKDPITETAEQLRYVREGQIAAQSGQHEQALTLYRQAVKQFPQEGDFHLEYARALQQAGQGREAEQHYRQGFKLKPIANPDLRLSYARLLTRQQRFNETVAQYRLMLKYDKTPSGVAYREMAGFYREVAGTAHRMGLAPTEGWLLRWAAYYDRCALTLDPKDYEALFGLGASQQQHGQSREAVATFCQAVALRPERPAARFSLGVNLVAIGHLKEGLAHMQGAIDAMRESDHPEAEALVRDWAGEVQAIRQEVKHRTGESLPLNSPASVTEEPEEPEKTKPPTSDEPVKPAGC